jgi:hypothetical protein
MYGGDHLSLFQSKLRYEMALGPEPRRTMSRKISEHTVS